MPIQVEREKWILYKHTSNYEMIKALALDVKNSCASDISQTERLRMQERLAALNLYKTRNPKERPLDSINHRINTLEFFMFGYEDDKRFIFSPLGNLFLKHINDDKKLKKIFASMLIGIQFEHYANGTPSCFKLYPFRLLLKLMSDERLNCRVYNTEYAYIIAFVRTIDSFSYEDLVNKILEFRKMEISTVAKILKEDEHTYVNCIYEWQYYMQKILVSAGILESYSGKSICKLYHPQKTNSQSNPTGRTVKDGYSQISSELKSFVYKMLDQYSFDSKPISLNDDSRMKMDAVKEMYSFYPDFLLHEIGEDVSEKYINMLRLPKLIERYANNIDNSTSNLFEDVLEDGFNMFYDVEAKGIGGPGNTDIECLYLTRKKKFAVEAKSTANKLSAINAGRLKAHRDKIGGKYTIVITPRFVPAVKMDIVNQPIVIISAHTFSEYLYNHIYHNVRDISYEDLDNIIDANLGKDVSRLISDLTMKKFAAKSK